ncbi:MAG: hypothetical protein ACYTEQ_30005 [Planctomycetota bacterium]|jgi:hypothetical protein
MSDEDRKPGENSTEDTDTGQQADTDTDTDVNQDTDTDNASTEDDRLARLEQRLEDTQKYVQQIQQEKADLNRQLEARKEPEYDADRFYQNPFGELDTRGYVRTDQVKEIAREIADERVSEAEAARFITSTPDMKKLAPTMRDVAEEMPGLLRLPRDQAVKAIYQIALGRHAGKPAPTEPSDPSKKERASTAGGGSGGKGTKKGELTLADIDKMSVEDMEKEFKFTDEG